MVSATVDRAREAQARWGLLSWNERKTRIERWWRALAGDAEGWADAIRAEIGKPRGEAMAETVMSLDAIRWTVRHGGRALREERIGVGWQRFLLIPGGRLHYQPFGVVGMIGTWNYPLYLNAPAIAQALAAGNAVVWKPSELAPLGGHRLQRSLDAAGLPDGLVSAVFGGAEVGSALVESAIDKGLFTGGVENGRRVLGALGSRGVPAVAELSGYDAAVVLPDAPRNLTVRALTWGAFVGSGQACVAVKRVYIVGDPAPWRDAIAKSANELRVGDPASAEIDLGPLITEAARRRFDEKVHAAVALGARVLAGGSIPSGPGWFYPPTVLAADTPEAETILAGVFGPVVIVRGVPDVEAAIAAANGSPFGLAASVWSRNLGAAKVVARRLVAGLVTINDAVTPTGHASSPFGGTKTSGFGRTKGVLGLREFTQPQAVLVRRTGGFRPQLFPYSSRMGRLFAWYRRFFHPSRR